MHSQEGYIFHIFKELADDNLCSEYCMLLFPLSSTVHVCKKKKTQAHKHIQKQDKAGEEEIKPKETIKILLIKCNKMNNMLKTGIYVHFFRQSC